VTAPNIVDQPIVLQTARGTSIDNERTNEVTRWDIGSDDEMRKKYGFGAQQRSGIDPLYNCHGLTFASRRTRVPDASSVRTMIDEDGYQEIDRNRVLEGDVVVYYSSDGDLEHSGIIVCWPQGQPLQQQCRVVSKWGRGSEMIHLLQACPYDATQIKFYRIRR
jgi:hypothetical protein